MCPLDSDPDLQACLTSLFPAEEFGVYGGLADTILHGLLASSGLGAVSGLANITPRACVEVVKLFQAGKYSEAKKLQGEVSLAGRVELKGGVPGMRYGVERWLGYGGVSRRPLPPASDQVRKPPITSSGAFHCLLGVVDNPRSTDFSLSSLRSRLRSGSVHCGRLSRRWLEVLCRVPRKGWGNYS